MSENKAEDSLENYANKDISLSNRYKSFVFLGFFRELISNGISILSYMVISRLLVIGVQDKMFFLSNGLFLTGNIALLGYTYSLTRKAFVDKHLNSIILYEGVSFLFLISLPLSFVLNILIGLIAGVSPIELILFLVSSILYFMYIVNQLVENIILQANRQVLIQTMYNILVSLSVPFLYYFFRSLSIVLIAWSISLMVPLLYERKILMQIFTNLKLNFKVNYDIIRYGFPIYIITLYGVLSTRVDNFILLLLFPKGTLAEYTWAFQLATAVLDIFNVLLIGTFPLLTAYFTRKNYDQFNETIKSILKIGLLIGLFLFGGAFIEGNFGVIFILSNKFANSSFLFKLLIISSFIRTFPLILNQVFQAKGYRRYMVKVSIVVNSARVLFLILFSYLGALGMAIVEILYSITFLFSNSYGERKMIFELIKTSKKSVLFFFIMTFIILFYPSFPTLLTSFAAGLIFVFIFILLMSIMKPLNLNDYSLIERVVGTKFNVNLIIKRFFVST